MIKKLTELFRKPSPSIVETPRDNTQEEILAKLKVLEEQQQELLKSQTKSDDDYKLTEKQQTFAISLIEKLNRDYFLGVSPEELTVKDLNRLLAYSKYGNKGALVNLQKKGVLKRK